MSCTCKIGPGKFEGEPARTFLAYQQMLLGNVDNAIGLLDFFKYPFNFDADREAREAAERYGYCTECIEAANAADCYGLSIYESDQGFVYLNEYATEAAYNAAVNAAEAEENLCPICGERPSIECRHCGVLACRECQADAHGEDDEHPWRCPKAPATPRPPDDEEPEDDITF